MAATALRLPARARPWWLWLCAWQWINRWRAQPWRRTPAVAAWLVSCVLLPAALRFSDPSTSSAALQWLLSFDVPLALLLAATTAIGVIAVANRPDTEDWLQPASRRGTAGRALFLLRTAGVLRWQAGIVFGAWLLAAGRPERQAQFAELSFIVLLGVTGGVLLGWVLTGQSAARTRPATAPRVSGLTALSLSPLLQTHRRLDLRRLAALAIPALLAAPMGATTGQVARMLATWIPLLYLGTCLREAANVSAAMRRWMPQARLGWWIWRHALLAAAAIAALLWMTSLLLRPERITSPP